VTDHGDGLAASSRQSIAVHVTSLQRLWRCWLWLLLCRLLRVWLVWLLNIMYKNRLKWWNSRRDVCDWITRHHHRLPPDNPRYQLDKSVHVHIGALVSARYTDDRWYRARIVAIYQSKGLLFLCCRNS